MPASDSLTKSQLVDRLAQNLETILRHQTGPWRSKRAADDSPWTRILAGSLAGGGLGALWPYLSPSQAEDPEEARERDRVRSLVGGLSGAALGGSAGYFWPMLSTLWPAPATSNTTKTDLSAAPNPADLGEQIRQNLSRLYQTDRALFNEIYRRSGANIRELLRGVLPPHYDPDAPSLASKLLNPLRNLALGKRQLTWTDLSGQTHTKDLTPHWSLSPGIASLLGFSLVPGAQGIVNRIIAHRYPAGVPHGQDNLFAEGLSALERALASVKNDPKVVPPAAFNQAIQSFGSRDAAESFVNKLTRLHAQYNQQRGQLQPATFLEFLIQQEQQSLDNVIKNWLQDLRSIPQNQQVQWFDQIVDDLITQHYQVNPAHPNLASTLRSSVRDHLKKQWSTIAPEIVQALESVRGANFGETASRLETAWNKILNILNAEVASDAAVQQIAQHMQGQPPIVTRNIIDSQALQKQLNNMAKLRVPQTLVEFESLPRAYRVMEDIAGSPRLYGRSLLRRRPVFSPKVLGAGLIPGALFGLGASYYYDQMQRNEMRQYIDQYFRELAKKLNPPAQNTP